ncbi:MAG: hypothetical protein EZS28_025022 [Streblomastix strix]|uniref:Uncharacterized protein n=1 Tax=Streblomastix strix TaxID=222440 RepID=A0A5J4VAG3_9EUKA|nr:MAG: hypothetical protein EZS28_025022 [Streblomastix strix]
MTRCQNRERFSDELRSDLSGCRTPFGRRQSMIGPLILKQTFVGQAEPYEREISQSGRYYFSSVGLISYGILNVTTFQLNVVSYIVRTMLTNTIFYHLQTNYVENSDGNETFVFNGMELQQLVNKVEGQITRSLNINLSLIIANPCYESLLG